MNPRVKEVTPEGDYRLRITFTNGETGIYDCRPLLDFGVFRELRDVGLFPTGTSGKRHRGLAPRTGYLPRHGFDLEFLAVNRSCPTSATLETRRILQRFLLASLIVPDEPDTCPWPKPEHSTDDANRSAASARSRGRWS